MYTGLHTEAAVKVMALSQAATHADYEVQQLLATLSLLPPHILSELGESLVVGPHDLENPREHCFLIEVLV